MEIIRITLHNYYYYCGDISDRIIMIGITDLWKCNKTKCTIGKIDKQNSLKPRVINT